MPKANCNERQQDYEKAFGSNDGKTKYAVVVTHFRLTLALEQSNQVHAFAVFNIGNFPDGIYRGEKYDQALLFAKVGERDFYFCFVCRNIGPLYTRDLEGLNLHILRIVKRVAVKGADLALGAFGILPDKICQRPIEIFVDQCTALSLKERTVVAVVCFVQCGDEVFRGACRRPAGISLRYCSCS